MLEKLYMTIALPLYPPEISLPPNGKRPPPDITSDGLLVSFPSLSAPQPLGIFSPFLK